MMISSTDNWKVAAQLLLKINRELVNIQNEEFHGATKHGSGDVMVEHQNEK